MPRWNFGSALRWVLLAWLVLVLALLPWLNGSFGPSHDPLPRMHAAHATEQATGHVEELHVQTEVHGQSEGHIHAHHTGDHSHVTAFLPPGAATLATEPTVRSATPYLIREPLSPRTRLERPPRKAASA